MASKKNPAAKKNQMVKKKVTTKKKVTVKKKTGSRKRANRRNTHRYHEKKQSIDYRGNRIWRFPYAHHPLLRRFRHDTAGT